MESNDNAANRGDGTAFGAISPLEPLDPTKFRNIMVEKQGSMTSQQGNNPNQPKSSGVDASRAGSEQMMGESRQTELDLGQHQQLQQHQQLTESNSSFIHPRFPSQSSMSSPFPQQSPMQQQVKIPPHHQQPPTPQQPATPQQLQQQPTTSQQQQQPSTPQQRQQQQPVTPQQQQQHQYFIHQNPAAHHYPPQPPTVQLHSPVHQYPGMPFMGQPQYMNPQQQSQIRISSPQQQHQYFVHQNAAHHYGAMASQPPSAQLQSPIQYPGMGFMVHGTPHSAGWNPQLQHQMGQGQPQYPNPMPQQGQLRMPSPQHQQQIIIAKQQQQQFLGTIPPYGSEGTQMLAYPVAHPLHQNVNVSPNANIQKQQQEFQQQQAQRAAVIYPIHQQYPGPSGFPMGANCMVGPAGGVMDPRQQYIQTAPVVPHSALPCSSPNPMQQPGLQIKKAQSLILHSSPEAIQQSSNSANLNFAAQTSHYIRPPNAQEFHNIQSQKQQSMVRIPVHQSTVLGHQFQLQPLPQYVGHEPQLAATLNPDICLAGCVFLLVDDCDPNLVDCSLLPSIIRFYGGDTETTNPRGIPERVTHIICSSFVENEELIKQALTPGFIDRIPRKLKRIVTLNWLNDAIEKRQVLPPTKAYHLPSVWSTTRRNPQLFSKVISACGFEKHEIIALKYMVQIVGARFSLEIEQETDFLVIPRNSLNEEINQKATRAGAVMVNYLWLLELYFGNLNVLTSPDNPRFSPHNENPQLTVSVCSPHVLAKISELCYKLMVPWSQSPIPLNDEIIRSAQMLKNNVKGDVNIFPEKQYNIVDNAPTEEQIEKANSLYEMATIRQQKQKYSVIFEGLYPDQVENLSKKVRFLGGQIADSVATCTHLVTTNLQKTVNLLEAIALGKNIVTPLWVETSYRHLGFVDELSFFVRDREHEKKYGFSLKATTLRTRHRKIFQDVKFHLSPGVQPEYDVIKGLIEAAGGTVQAEKPKGKDLLKFIQDNHVFFVVCDWNSLNTYQYLMKINFPILNEDFVLMAILRHKIDLSDEFRSYPNQPIPKSIPLKV